jgi:hypothetical protein
MKINMFGKKQSPTERPRRAVQPAQQRSAVFSYHANRTQRPGSVARDRFTATETRPSEPALATIRLSRVAKRAPQLLVLVAVAVLVLMNLRLDGQAKVEVVGASQGQVFLRSRQHYEAAAARAFSTPANSTKLTVNTSAITTRLQQEFPELQSVSITLPVVGTQPVVYIQPAIPKLILTTQTNGLYVLDESGRALIAGNDVPTLGKLMLPVVADQSNLDIDIGDIALPRSSVAFVDEVVYQLKAKDITVSSLTLPAGAGELHVRMEGVPYLVKYNLYGNAREEVGAYLALKKRLETERRTPKEYVDVRVERRVYYK